MLIGASILSALLWALAPPTAQFCMSCGAAQSARRVIAPGKVASVGELAAHGEHPKAVGEERATITGQQDAARARPMLGVARGGVVTSHAVTLEDGLDVARKIEYIRNAGDRPDGAGCPAKRQVRRGLTDG